MIGFTKSINRQHLQGCAEHFHIRYFIFCPILRDSRCHGWVVMIKVRTTCHNFNSLTSLCFSCNQCDRNRTLLEMSWIRALVGQRKHTQDGPPYGSQGQLSIAQSLHNPPENWTVISACLTLSSFIHTLDSLVFPSPWPHQDCTQTWHMGSNGIPQNLNCSSKIPGRHLSYKARVRGAPLFNWL